MQASSSASESVSSLTKKGVRSAGGLVPALDSHLRRWTPSPTATTEELASQLHDFLESTVPSDSTVTSWEEWGDTRAHVVVNWQGV